MGTSHKVCHCARPYHECCGRERFWPGPAPYSGWQCPSCGRVNAPSRVECPCSRIAAPYGPYPTWEWGTTTITDITSPEVTITYGS